MITSVTGRTFLNAYNEKYGKKYSPKEFFKEEYWQTFFNHEKYLMSGGNSPFENPKISWEKMIKGIIPFEDQEQREERFMKFMEKAQAIKGNLDASIAMGFPASDEREYASTSGLVSDLAIPVDEDEVYLSWIGSGLGITVAGGFSILFDNPFITLQTFEGWKHYRKYLNDQTLDKLRGNQINTWNGQWLTYSLDTNKFREGFDFTELQSNGIFKVEASLAEVNTVKWSQLFFSLSQEFPKEELMGYVYGFGQTNKTIGFIPFQFKSGTRLKDVYSQLFGGKFSNAKEFESLFGMRFKQACELGSIGLLALRPDSLLKYMQESKNLNFKNEGDLINYQAYKTWLIAMLSKNKEQITDYTMEMAKTIHRYRAGGTKLDRKTLIEKELLVSSTKKAFIEALTKMVKDMDESDLGGLKRLRDEVHLMTNEEFTYFCTLLKFDYAFVDKQS